MIRKIWLLTAVFLLGFILRFYQLGKIPASVEWDEAAIGYDAYSILKTGRDQFGQFLPNTFRSLDDWKPPIYEYIAVPAVAIFGLNAFSTRFPSALFGSLTVLGTYWLTVTIFKSRKMGLLAAFFLAVSPWNLQFSRAAFEMNISVFITVMAVASFLKGLKDYRYFPLAGLLFGLDLFSYHSTRIVAPLILLSLFAIFNKTLPPKKYSFSFLIIFGIFVLSFIPIVLSPEAQIRFTATNIFNPGARYLNERDLPSEYLKMRQEDSSIGYELAGRIFHNPRLIFLDYETLKTALNHYLSNFGFEFLFVRGDAPLHHAPGFGLLYIWEFPFIIMGILYLIGFKMNRYSMILPLWLMFVPIPDAVTREAPHAVRSELFLPVLQILVAMGICGVGYFLKNEANWFKKSLIILSAVLFMPNHAYYLFQYYVHTDYDLSKNWLYGRQQAVEFTEKGKVNYDKVLVSLKVDMPYIFWLFYSKYPPQKYLIEGGTVSGGFADERNHFDKYEFRNFSYRNLPKDKKLLLVSTPDYFPPDAKILKTIYYKNGTEALVVASN